MQTCPSCSKNVPADALACIFCGASLTSGIDDTGNNCKGNDNPSGETDPVTETEKSLGGPSSEFQAKRKADAERDASADKKIKLGCLTLVAALVLIFVIIVVQSQGNDRCDDISRKAHDRGLNSLSDRDWDYYKYCVD